MDLVFKIKHDFKNKNINNFNYLGFSKLCNAHEIMRNAFCSYYKDLGHL